jgi:hypothetical protein
MVDGPEAVAHQSYISLIIQRDKGGRRERKAGAASEGEK